LLAITEKTGSESAQILLTKHENERRGNRAIIEHLNLQLEQSQIEITPEAILYIMQGWRDQFNRLHETGTIREIKDFMMIFIKRIGLGYNQAKIYYTNPVTDASKARFIEDECGGINFQKPSAGDVERFLSILRLASKGKLGDLGIDINYFSPSRKK